MAKPLRLLILDNDSEAAERLSLSLSGEGIVVYATHDPDEACHLISLLQHDILLIDIEKLVCTPLYPLQKFRQLNPDLKIVGISDSRRGDTGLLLDLLGLDAYLWEPVSPESLIISVPMLADQYRMAWQEKNGDHKKTDLWRRSALPPRGLNFIQNLLTKS